MLRFYSHESLILKQHTGYVMLGNSILYIENKHKNYQGVV